MTEALAIVCRNCAYDFVLPAGELLFPCPACGAAHSRPRATGSALADLRRAHQQRAACDFTNAAANYQRVLNLHPDEAEALWGLSLCKYGVEYVRDERTGASLPVVHFLNRRPITEDPDCRLAIARAGADMRPAYERDAAYIARIQQEVLAAEQRGDAWDVFLCYKASVPGGGNAHTREFDHARDLYSALREAGYSVFFAHTTLREVAGANYEAQVFHALQSAKVMLVVTSDPAYLATPWVHSEWSRYLERVDAREDCRLIPLLYDRCDPYALPDAFLRRSIQALLMGSLTALDDLRRILAQQVHPAAAAPATASTNDRALLRISMALEDGDWQKAESLAAALIDEAPDCAEAHLSRLLAKRKVADLTALAATDTPFDGDVSWKRAMRFADAGLKQRMAECLAKFAAKQRAAEEEKARREAAEKARREAEERGRLEAAAQARREAEEKARREAEEKARLEAAEKEAQQRIAKLRAAGLHTIAAGSGHTVGLQADGTVVAIGKYLGGQCDVRSWRRIVAIAASGAHTVGLREDGAVFAVGSNTFGQCNVNGWRDIVAITAGFFHTVGLRSDGTVIAIGDKSHNRCNVSGWKDIVAIAAGFGHTVGLRADGTVVAVGDNSHRQCNVRSWKGIVAIAAGSYQTIGLRADGTVIAVGDNTHSQCSVSNWKNIVAITASSYQTVGLRADGTAVAIGLNNYGQCDVYSWEDIVSIVAGHYHTVGLRADGTVIATGDNNDRQCNVSSWRLKQVPRPTLPE